MASKKNKYYLLLIALLISFIIVLAYFGLTNMTASSITSPPKGSNRLAFETSPYLLQHAENPVDWYAWGEEAFEKAKKENKPIFLSVGYSTCYWCHVMERESFTDAEVAKNLNQNFISIKVDREERPDVDEIYMKAVQIISGRGGWPMTVFLTPDLKPFFGATYFPKVQFIDLLNNVSDAWETKNEAILQDADKITSIIQSLNKLPESSATKISSDKLISTATAQYKDIFDPTDGGFGDAPKFPQPSRLELLMSDHQIFKQAYSMKMVNITLDRMARGGIYDQVGGGFHRYSTDKEWLVPHFEKMLYDNAQLLHAYTRAYAITGNKEYKRIAEQVIEYVKREMTAADGLFYSSQDAEVDHEEGKSYRWSKQELQDALTEVEFSLIDNVYGVVNGPNFEGYYILFWPKPYAETAKQNKLTLEQLFNKIDQINSKLLLTRDKRPQPLLDDKSITAWNGLMIEALAYAGKVFKNEFYTNMASKAAGQLLKTLRNKDGQLLHVSRSGKAKLDAYLDDYAATILGFIALADATQQDSFREQAVKLADQMIEKLWNPRGDFYYATDSANNLLTRQQHPYDGALPSGNSLAARALVELSNAGYAKFQPYATQIYQAYTPLLEKSSAGFPYMLWGLSAYKPTVAQPSAQASLLKSETKIKINASLLDNTLILNQSNELLVTLKMNDGWHINSNSVAIDLLIPTTVTAELADGKLKLDINYPKGEEVTIGPDKRIISVYQGQVTIPVKITVTKLPAQSDQVDLTISAKVQTCNDSGRCLLPSTLQVVIPVTVKKQ